MSLWFAGLGLLTLVGALFLSKAEDDIPTVDAEYPGRQQVDALLPVPGPASETRDPGPVRQAGLANTQSNAPALANPRLVDPAHASPLLEGSEREGRAEQEPIGGAVLQRGSGTARSWKANHEPAVRTPLPGGERASARNGDAASASAGEVSAGKLPGGSGSGGSVSAGRVSAARVSSGSTSSGSADISTAPRPSDVRKPAAARSGAKKPTEPKRGESKTHADTEVDFGI